MAEKSREWSEEKFRVGDAELHVLKGGKGKPLLVFHGELGHPVCLKWHSALAQKRTLWIPLHPGFDRSPIIGWLMDVRDLASFYSRFILEQSRVPADVIGFSLRALLAVWRAVKN